MSILIFLIVSYILLSIALYFVFPKCGKPAMNGLIPFVNFMDWAEIIGRPRWYAFLLLIPIVNIFIFVGMAIDLGRSFDKFDFKHTAAATVFAPAFLGYLAKNDKAKYVGPILDKERDYQEQIIEAKKAGKERSYQKLVNNSPFKKSAGREWFESIFFAVFAAAFIRMFLIEAYVIPTPSMEGSLNVGDFLFVSKSSYGIRTPMTIAMIPLLHNRIPVVNKESYLKSPNLPYYRLPALRKIKHNSPIVFNWPVGDSVYITPTRSYTMNQVSRNPAYQNSDRYLVSKVKNKDFVVRPLDKKDHYIKRAVGLPGDSLQIIDRQVYINGEPGKNPKNMQFLYGVNLTSPLNEKKLINWEIDEGDIAGRQRLGQSGGYFLTNEQVDNIKNISPQSTLTPYAFPENEPNTFPHDSKLTQGWSVDNFGPIYIPEAGATVDISTDNIAFYKRIIGVYEHNDLEIKNGQIYINGELAKSYTFKQDYYWAMGDNRHNSEDSRAWGYVPHDHIVGRPLFIWFSTKEGSIKNGINWNRLFKSATKE